MNTLDLLDRALDQDFLSVEEGLYLYDHAPLPQLMYYANELRKVKKADTPGIVTWQIDRNVNTTNVCVANCKFCNFFRVPGHPESYITDDATYKQKIDEMFALGGDQLLLQGGHHPELGIEFYEDLFRRLKGYYPHLRLHSLGPPEIVHISELSKLSYEETLRRLKAAGLDIPSSATMMFGHIETLEERFLHLVWLREVQSEKPAHAMGFKAFIPWVYQDDGTLLQRKKNVRNTTSAEEYVRMLALCRLMLPNIENLQVSWLTVGPKVAQMCLHAGANDMGSIMIEENVVSAAGAPYRFTAQEIQRCIVEAGFEPRLRDQIYRFREVPEVARLEPVAA